MFSGKFRKKLRKICGRTVSTKPIFSLCSVTILACRRNRGCHTHSLCTQVKLPRFFFPQENPCFSPAIPHSDSTAQQSLPVPPALPITVFYLGCHQQIIGACICFFLRLNDTPRGPLPRLSKERIPPSDDPSIPGILLTLICRCSSTD